MDLPKDDQNTTAACGEIERARAHKKLPTSEYKHPEHPSKEKSAINQVWCKI